MRRRRPSSPHKRPEALLRRKERAALNRLARYLHELGAIDATEILMVEAGVEREADARPLARNSD